MKNRFALLLRYLKFFLRAKNEYSIHSPFVYKIYNEVLKSGGKSQTNVSCLQVEAVVKELYRDKTPVNTADTGCPGRQGKRKTVGSLAASLSQTKKSGRLLSRLVKYFMPLNIIELGTGAGVGSLYLASADVRIPVYSIEGNPQMAQISSRLIHQSRLSNVSLRKGMFDDVLPVILKETEAVGLMFIDGDHNSQSLIRYYSMIKPFLNKDSIIVLHDIYWSDDMLNGWKTLIAAPEVRVSVDVFHFGILFFDDSLAKQHFMLRI
jgi:predicted O-methyltransferase YrrM